VCGLTRELAARGETVGALFLDAAARHPSLGRHLFDDAGRLRGWLTVFVNDADARGAGGLAAPVGERDVVTILPPIAGGESAQGPTPAPGARAFFDLSTIVKHAEAEYPREACGLVLEEEASGAMRAVPAANAADDPRLRFAIAPEVLLRELAAARAAGERLAFVYHSHADRSAALSVEDERLACLGDGPAWPGVGWLVISVESGRARAARLHTWRGRGFEAEDVALTRE